MTENDCIFCKIVAGEIPSTTVYEDDQVKCFKDLYPRAPLHVLVVPKRHVANVVELAEHPELLAHVATTAGAIAKEHSNGEFRFVFNTGETAGQSVFHVHGHVLSGTQLTEGDL